MTSFNKYLDEHLKDPNFKAEYNALESEFEAIQATIDAEKEAQVERSVQEEFRA